jgi:hypothetical protein
MRLVWRIFVTFFIMIGGQLFAQEAKVKTVPMGMFQGTVYSNETFFINDEKAPVKISKVSAEHIPKSTSELADQVWDYYRDNNLQSLLTDTVKKQIRANLKSGLTVSIDAESNDVVAVKFGIVAYDAFKEHLGSLTGVTMEPPKTGMSWEFNPSYLFLFKRYGVIGAYVRQARMKDGTIWNFDEEETMQKFFDTLGVKISLSEEQAS